MLSYQTLGFIASSVNPTLGVIALAMAFSFARRQGVKRPAAHIVALLTGVAFAYVGWALKVSGIWPLFTQHYSTHSAVCVAIVSYLTFASRHWLRALWPAIGIAYAALMLHQQYHTLVHILMTVAVVGPPVLLLHNRALRNSL
jgi:hypothetical protein